VNLIRRSALVVALPALLLAACGSDESTGGTSSDASAAAGEANTFVLDEWSIVPPSAEIAAGETEIIAENVGVESHEIVIVRAGDGPLPTKEDGSVDEDAIPEADVGGRDRGHRRG